MIRIAGSVSKSWLASRVGVAFDRDYYFEPRRRHEVDRLCNDYVRRALPDWNVFYTESNLGRIEYFADNQVLVGGIQPNMIVGMLLGAEFVATDDADADITPGCLGHISAADLPAPETLLDHALVREFDRQLRHIQADRSSRRHAIPPFFWDASGRAAVHGAVTSGLKYYGDAFFLALATDPERCDAIVRWLTDVSALLVQHFAQSGRMPVHGIHVGECAACMIDVDNFRRFVVPTVSMLGRLFKQVRFHSCGRSDHLIEACRQIEGLAELDVGGATSVAVIRTHFGTDFPVGIAPLVDDMRSLSTAPILAWFRRVAEENAEGDLTIGFHFEKEYNAETIQALHDAIREFQR